MTQPFARIFALASFSTLLVFAACVPEHQPTSEITTADIEHTIGVLAGDSMRGRESGSRYSRQAADIIAARMRADGLTPAFGDSFLQKFTFKGERQAGPGNAMKFTPRPELRGTDKYKKRIKALAVKPEPLPFSPPGQVEGELVFGGFCLGAEDWDDFARVDVKDRVVLCLRYGPGGRKNEQFAKDIPFKAKYTAVKKRGASGVVFLGREGTPSIRAASVFAKPEAGPVAVFLEPGDFHRALPFLGEVEEALAAGKPSDQVGKELGHIELKTDYHSNPREAFNVGGYLYPTAEDQRVLIIGAHHDHIGMGYFSSMGARGKIHNGADDNASGVAVTLEAAAALAAGPRLPGNFNVLFLTFDGEERGLFGSRHFVKSQDYPGARAVAMINLDMVGRLRPRKGLSVQGADSGEAAWKEILETAFAGAKFADDVELKLIRGGSGPSDHTPFYNNGLPVAFIFTGGHREYHTERDTQDLLNLPGIASVTRMSVGIARGLAERGKGLAYRKAPAEPKRSAFSFRVRLGVMPANYDADAEGLEVASVRDDAPIASSGIQRGDVILQIDDMKIANIRDVMSFLSDASLNKKYRIVYRRGGEMRETTTELMEWQ